MCIQISTSQKFEMSSAKWLLSLAMFLTGTTMEKCDLNRSWFILSPLIVYNCMKIKIGLSYTKMIADVNIQFPFIHVYSAVEMG